MDNSKKTNEKNDFPFPFLYVDETGENYIKFTLDYYIQILKKNIDKNGNPIYNKYKNLEFDIELEKICLNIYTESHYIFGTEFTVLFFDKGNSLELNGTKYFIITE
ncbi:MAG: hypothetical protein K8R31_05715 [Bacteroidales bacterium]|nr:hypothetical protein [Bacteroidales bacterium]